MMVTTDFRHGRNPGDPEPFLARSRLLREAEPEARAQLARAARRVSVSRGTAVYGSADAAGGVYIVASGYVTLVMQDEKGGEKVVDICGPGENFGEDCLTGTPCSVTARVVSAGLLLHLPREAVLDAIDRYPRLARCMLRSVSRKIVRTTAQIGGAATHSGIQRLAGYLLRSVPPEGNEPATVTLAVPKRLLASLLGLSKETFSRLLAVLASRGLIEVRGRNIRIPRPEALVELCSEGAGCIGCIGCPRGSAWLP